MRPKSTPDRWWLVPLPPDENVSWPGFAFASATMSAGFVAALAGGTIITFDTPPMNDTGAKSFVES